MNIATPQWEYRPVSPKEAPISPDQPSSVRKWFPRLWGRAQASPRFRLRHCKLDNAQTNRLCAVVQSVEPLGKPGRASDKSQRLRYKQLVNSRRLFFLSAGFSRESPRAFARSQVN